MARRPEDRFQTAAEAAGALQALAGQEAGVHPAPRPMPGPSPERSVPRPVAATGPILDRQPLRPGGRRPPGPGDGDLVGLRRFVAARLPAFALTILLFVLALFGLGVALGHVLAIRRR